MFNEYQVCDYKDSGADPTFFFNTHLNKKDDFNLFLYINLTSFNIENIRLNSIFNWHTYTTICKDDE